MRPCPYCLSRVMDQGVSTKNLGRYFGSGLFKNKLALNEDTKPCLSIIFGCPKIQFGIYLIRHLCCLIDMMVQIVPPK